MHKTPLHDQHVALGAKMVWFAGWDMPTQYTSIIDEHMAVRERSGAFDVSHMGDFIIRGQGAGNLVNTFCTNDIQGQPVGRCVYAHILDDQGRILDDTIVTVLGEDEYFVVPNAATTPKIRKWVEGHLHGQEFYDMSMDLATIAVQGPTAQDVVAELTSADLSSLKFFWGGFVRMDRITTKDTNPTTVLMKGRKPKNGPVNGIMALVSRTGYTGEDGFEIVCENADAVAVWNAVLERGKAFGLKPIGLGARDTLRLEKALLLSGTDFDGSQTSLQTGPGWVIDWKHDFIGKQPLLQQKAAGDYDKLVCMLVEERGIPRHGYDIMTGGKQIGTVTSGTLSPVLKKGIAMGYVPLATAKTATELQIKIRDNLVTAEIVKPPFVKRD
ncbi:MAG: glycine cleavage system aminomethyltransferase GcvT [Thermoplasmatota archaeon]|nr:glycine cleavage system aminomethyltransferase GcvT [Candidatus Thermoplasmatota archaeon]MBU1915314.1 glycine cleavage system aminomethyltransferase GcvT [Candidatus Thermoplasmatota archaeon]